VEGRNGAKIKVLLLLVLVEGEGGWFGRGLGGGGGGQNKQYEREGNQDFRPNQPSTPARPIFILTGHHLMNTPLGLAS
jgi:hypothetical protein